MFSRPLLWNADDFVNWLTDITKTEPTVCGAEAVWSITSSDVITGLLKLPIGVGLFTDPAVIAAMLRIYQCFKNN
jgi:hypothetical protein